MNFFPMFTLIVSGSRHWDDRETLFHALDEVKKSHETLRVVQGGCDGVDFLTAHWCLENEVPCVTCKADWKTHGRSAGPIRNRRMLEDFKPDLVYCFPQANSRGTRNMISLARTKGLPLLIKEG